MLIAYALTILERVLLPERPAFFVTASKRGSGKTTALMMLILAVTGKKPAAAAWSSSEEERRKAVLSYLAESLPAMVWDNIPLGTLIACPTLEKVLTAESYSDRVLGQSTTLTVPSFTGNNIGPKGDMSSRSLITRLEVDRIDPENRRFIHADPVAWTLGNHGLILRALYVILLANPQLNPEHRKEAKTRLRLGGIWSARPSSTQRAHWWSRRKPRSLINARPKKSISLSFLPTLRVMMKRARRWRTCCKSSTPSGRISCSGPRTSFSNQRRQRQCHYAAGLFAGDRKPGTPIPAHTNAC